MNKDKSSAQTHIPGRGLFARYPLTFYFIIAYVGTWLVWSLFVLSQNGAGLLAFRSPMSYMITIFVGQIFGPTLAAFLMTSVTEGNAGLRRFMRRIVEWRVGIRFNYEIKI
jgi:CAAX protease family protein